ncbi:uncharacterized protein [Aegilops tauschii subsp. strangulata]|uniref:uncharacterized protein n=1 Tax=Aegilops tauschii subsp. strangulata TaxID=200361 RepID=UPI001E1CAB38|nr:uncharacterized protein LOC109767256 [Aegilops tauschii subsp. strangulata]
MTWEHYLAAPAPPGERIGGVECHTVADVVILTFWTFYRCAEGQEEAATRVIEAECRRLLQNWRNGARTQATRDYFTSIGIRMSKSKCRTKYLSKEKYMKVPPRWGVDRLDCWEALVDEWCSPQWLSTHNNAKDRRGKMSGVPHHQGSVNLYQYGDNWVRHNETDVPELFDLYSMAHSAPYKKAKAFSESDLDDPKNFTNRASHNKLVRYRDEGKARKGPDFNPSQPIDLELVMISGGGRNPGLLAIGDGLIRCTSTLPQIKRRQTSSDPEIRPRPRPMDLEIKAAIEEERAKTQELLAEERRHAAEREREIEERTARLLEEERNRNDLANRAIYELFASMCEKNGQTPPPMPVIAPADTHNSRQASTSAIGASKNPDPPPSATTTSKNHDPSPTG